MEHPAIVIAWALGIHVVLSLFVWMVVAAATQRSTFRADRDRPDEAFPLRLSALHLCANLGALFLGLVPTGDTISGAWESAFMVTLLLLGGWTLAMASAWRRHRREPSLWNLHQCGYAACMLAVMGLAMLSLLQVSLA